MSDITTVRTPHRATFNAAVAMDALAQLAAAESISAIGAGVGELSAALGMPHFVMLHLDRGGQWVRNVVHNLGHEPDVDAMVGSDLIGALVARPLPLLLNGQLADQHFGHGVAVSAPHGSTVAVLLLGCGAGDVDPDSLSTVMGLSCMAASHLADVLRRLAPSGCPLTERELQSLAYVAAGANYKEAALGLNISPRTVEKYVERSRRRLGVETSMAAAVLALRRGWISGADLDELKLTSRRRYGAGPGR